jgi:hypothetical protein
MVLEVGVEVHFAVPRCRSGPIENRNAMLKLPNGKIALPDEN